MAEGFFRKVLIQELVAREGARGQKLVQWYLEGLNREVHGGRQSLIQIPGQGHTKVVPRGVVSVEDTKPCQKLA